MFPVGERKFVDAECKGIHYGIIELEKGIVNTTSRELQEKRNIGLDKCKDEQRVRHAGYKTADHSRFVENNQERRNAGKSPCQSCLRKATAACESHPDTSRVRNLRDLFGDLGRSVGAGEIFAWSTCVFFGDARLPLRMF